MDGQQVETGGEVVHDAADAFAVVVVLFLLLLLQFLEVGGAELA